MRRLFAIFAVALFILASPALLELHAQQSSRLSAIRFTGLNRFTVAQVTRATGLKMRDPVSKEQLGAVADRLAKSGAFDHVSFHYSTEGNDLTVEFQLRETRYLLPCHFDNFVWFSDQQLDQALRERVSFYAGAVPESGNTMEEACGALRDVIRANGIPGDVDAIPFAAVMGQPVSGFSFSVKGISLLIRSVTFPGAAAVTPSVLASASSQIMGRDFSISGVAAFASGGLIPIYHERGYLRARFDQPQASVISKSSGGAVQEIGVTLPVQEGPEFYWEKAEWSGNIHFSTIDLDRMLGMTPKEIANEQKIDSGLRAVKRAYGQKGFIDADVRPKVVLDDGTRLTTYDVSVVEGIQYRFSQVHFDGLTDRAAQQLVKQFRLKPGDLLDASYTLEFMNKVAPQTLHDLGIVKTSSEFKPQRDEQKATVDLHIVYH